MGNKKNYSPVLPKLLDKLGLEKDRNFSLLDVGASGGIAGHWLALGEKLEAVGFDPLVAEVNRLNGINKNPKIRYEEGYVIYADQDKHYPLAQADLDSAFYNSYRRSSSVRAAETQHFDYARTHFNSGAPIIFSDRFFQLDDYVKKNKISAVDFIKIDTDGHDFPVLLGAEKTIDNGGVLGIAVEVQFHGAPHPYANTFTNIDQFLRSKGFTLFDLDIFYYSRADLPGEFFYDIFAQTKAGQVQWGEAVYFRDLGNKDYGKRFNFPITRDKVITLACLYELYGLDDCAAELLINNAEKFNFKKNLDILLDALTPRFKGEKLGYREYVKKFDSAPSQWFPDAPPSPSNHTLAGLIKKILSLCRGALRRTFFPTIS